MKVMSILKEFLGVGGYQRVPEGYMSWQHLTFASCLMVLMIALSLQIVVVGWWRFLGFFAFIFSLKLSFRTKTFENHVFPDSREVLRLSN